MGKVWNLSQVDGASWQFYIGSGLEKELCNWSARDAIKLAIPGEHDEMTLSFWVKADRLDHEYNALAVWNRALTIEKIQAHYEAGRPSLLDK